MQRLGKLMLLISLMPFNVQAAVETTPITYLFYMIGPSGYYPVASLDASGCREGEIAFCARYICIGPPNYFDISNYAYSENNIPGCRRRGQGVFGEIRALCDFQNSFRPFRYNHANKTCERDAPENYTITLSGGNTVEPSGSSSVNTLPIIATVKDKNTGQAPTTPVTVNIRLKVDPTSGGHEHGDSNRPRGGIADVKSCESDETCWSGQTDGSGKVTFNFSVPEAAGTHTITAECDECSKSDSKDVEVKVSGLMPIPALPFYALAEANGDVIGAKQGWHTDNHYLTSGAAAVLARIAVYYRFSPRFYLRNLTTGQASLPQVLHLNDASLKWGGVYDICARPGACSETGIVTWHKPHAEHRHGIVIDVRANGGDGAIPPINKMKFENYLIEQGISYKYEDAGSVNEHFHIRLMGKRG